MHGVNTYSVRFYGPLSPVPMTLDAVSLDDLADKLERFLDEYTASKVGVRLAWNGSVYVRRGEKGMTLAGTWEDISEEAIAA